MLAPVLSAAVIFLSSPGEVSSLPPVPAPPSGLLLPPDSLDFGAASCFSLTKLDAIALKPVISCSIPVVPSQFFWYHREPHVRPLSPPVHCCAAVTADAFSFGIISFPVSLTSVVIVASQAIVTPLNKAELPSQTLRISQLYSDMITLPYRGGKNSLKIVFSNPSTRSFHFSPSPFVYSEEVSRAKSLNEATVTTTYVVIHVSRAAHIHAVVLRPLNVRGPRTVIFVISTVGDGPSIFNRRV